MFKNFNFKAFAKRTAVIAGKTVLLAAAGYGIYRGAGDFGVFGKAADVAEQAFA